MTLKDLRKEIDEIDNKIIYLLEKRFKIVKKTKFFKKQIKDPKREKEILSNIKSKDIQEIYKNIFKISKKIQN